jgi:hypothetical protein
VQQDPLVDPRDTQDCADLLRCPAVDVAKAHDLSLQRRKTLHLCGDVLQCLGLQQSNVGTLTPVRDGRDPVASPFWVVGRTESAQIHERLARSKLARSELREGDGAALAGPALACDVREDPEDPGAEGGPLLEPIETLDDREPRLLRHLLGCLGFSHIEEGDPDHRVVVPRENRLECARVAAPEPLHQHVVRRGGIHHAYHVGSGGGRRGRGLRRHACRRCGGPGNIAAACSSLRGRGPFHAGRIAAAPRSW